MIPTGPFRYHAAWKRAQIDAVRRGYVCRLAFSIGAAIVAGVCLAVLFLA